MATVNSDSVQMVDSVAPTYLKTLSQIYNNEEVNLLRFINPAQWAAIQAGTSSYNAFTDLAAAFNSGAKALFAPAGIYSFAGDLPAIHIGVILRGAGCGEYVTQGASTQGLTIFQRTDVGTSTSSVLTLSDGATITTLQVRPANYAAVNFAVANYPAGTGNVAYGIKMGSQTAQARHVNALGFSTAGFLLETTSVLERCYAYMNNIGYLADPNGATDGCLLNCVGMFNQTAGADLRSVFWQVNGGRWEWNARYGLMMGGESVCTGAVFDRNGFAGLWIAPGFWGKTITGNYFARNGCGGDGVSGRWGFSTPSDPSYVAVPAGQSCQIQVDFEHAVTITGNRFRSGQDDSNSGSNAPQFVYGGGSGTAPGATPTNGIVTGNNMGDRSSHSVLGYNPTYAGGTGHPAGGPDTGLNSFLNSL